MSGRGSFKGLGAGQILALGKVSAWLRLAQGTVTGAGYSSIPDMLGGSPAEQSTDARRPVNGASTNGLPIATYTTQVLQWPLGTGNNGAVKMGMAGWFKLANVTGNKTIATITLVAGGASANKLLYMANSANLRCDDQTVDRHAVSSGTVDTAWRFLYFGIDASLATEALQVQQAIDGVAQTVSFSSDTAWSTNLGTPTGNMLIGAGTTAAASPFVGSMGPNLFFLNAQLSAAELTILMNFETPT